MIQKGVYAIKPNDTNLKLKFKINKFFSTKWKRCSNNSIHNNFFLEEWKPIFRKSKKGICHNIPIEHWSHKTYTHLNTQTSRTTTAYSMSKTS